MVNPGKAGSATSYLFTDVWWHAGGNAYDCLEGRFRLVVGVEQQWLAIGASGDAIVYAPQRHDPHGILMFQESPEKARIGIGQFPVRVTDHSALGG